MGSTAAGAESSSSSSIFNCIYHVFLSFRGEDTRSNFTSVLEMVLRDKGVNVFIDDRLERGEQISETLIKTIQNSLISIVIFSQNYASSTWCLDELVEIIECKKSKGRKVWPIFYKVDPSDVRKQTGCFEEALAKHQANFMEKIPIWRDALTTAGNLAGWDLKTIRKEADLIQIIVERVLSIIHQTYTPDVAKHLVGIDSETEIVYWVKKMYKSECVDMLGIYGIGGIGKTTLAKALYNKMARQFEGCCYLPDVREASKQFHGLAQLQKKLIFQILKYDLQDVDLDRGINIIKNGLRSKKVLILLDDVDKIEQLRALVGGHDWFGQGSKIIVTTRNKHLLDSHGFGKTYEVKGLSEDDAIELFRYYACDKSHPSCNYPNLLERATRYCKGHPLALVVLGSFLCSRNQAEWSGLLNGFETSLREDIKNVLKLSFDGLEDEVKEIFLDISCLLVGERVTYVKKMLSEWHSILDFGITKLRDLSLITFEDGKVQMHDLIKQMGQKIVVDESLGQPGKRSRLWSEKEIREVFSNNSGTNAIKAIKLVLPNDTRVDMDPEAFRSMKNLRLVIVDGNVRFCRKIKYLPNGLKWIKWHRFPHSSLPSCFITKDLVGLDLQHSLIGNLGKGLKNGKMLKLLDLRHSTLLKKIPELSAPNLEELYLSNCKKLEKIPNLSSALNLKSLCLEGCTELRKIHDSIGSLSKLVTLNLQKCSELKKIPSYILWESLEDLNLAHCEKLEAIPDLSSALTLKSLCLEGCTKLRKIHDSIGSLSKLDTLNLQICPKLNKIPSNISWNSLTDLKLAHCKMLVEIPDLSSASNLKRLYLEQCINLRVIHESIGSLDNLYRLDLRQCTNLEKLPSYLKLKSLTSLILDGCCKLEIFPEIDENMKSLNFLNLNSTAVKELPSSIRYLTGLSELRLNGCTNLISLPHTTHLLKSLVRLGLSGCSRLEMIDIYNPTINPVCSSSKIMETPSTSELFDVRVPKESLCSKLYSLHLEGCNISNVDFLEILSKVSPSLHEIVLSKNNFSSLPSCLHKFTFLSNLQIRNCKLLQEIPNLPRCIEKVDATGCVSLDRSPDNIVDIISSEDNLRRKCPREFVLMNSGIPKCLSYRTTSNSIRVSFERNPNKETTLVTSVTFRVDGDSYQGMAVVSCNIFIGCRLQSCFMRKFPSSTSEYTWIAQTFSKTYGTSLEMNDDVIVWFEVVKCPEVVTIRSCGVHLTEIFYGIQSDVKGPGSIYTDFDQLDEFPRRYRDVVKSFAQDLSAKSDCHSAVLVADNFLMCANSKMELLSHAYSRNFRWKRGMEGIAEITLNKSIWDKFVKDNDISSEILACNDFSAMPRGYRDGRFIYLATHDRLPFQRYFRSFFGSHLPRIHPSYRF